MEATRTAPAITGWNPQNKLALFLEKQKTNSAGSSCPVCSGAKRYLQKRGDAYVEVRCKNCVDLLSLSRLTEADKLLTVDSLADRDDDIQEELPAMRFLAKQMLSDPFGFLSFCGNSGDGKSLIIRALVAEFCRQGTEGRYYTATELAHAVTPHQGEDGTNDLSTLPIGEVLAILKRVPVLAIDELDKITWTAWRVQHLGEVIDYRYERCEELVTLFVMNKEPSEWSVHAGVSVDAIASRLRDGRFNRRWQYKVVPACITDSRNVMGEIIAPGFFTTTLPDVRPVLTR